MAEMIIGLNVFPTCVGMNRIMFKIEIETGSVPHMRGDEPPYSPMEGSLAKCSPHAWG